MRFNSLVLGLFGLHYVTSSYTEISPYETNEITSTINEARREVPATYELEVSWNTTMQAKLTDFTASINPYWYFNESINPLTGNLSYNVINLINFPEFAKYKDDGWRFMLHDTCQNTANAVEKDHKR